MMSATRVNDRRTLRIYLFNIHYYIIQVVLEVQKENTIVLQKNTQNYKLKNIVPS